MELKKLLLIQIAFNSLPFSLPLLLLQRNTNIHMTTDLIQRSIVSRFFRSFDSLHRKHCKQEDLFIMKLLFHQSLLSHYFYERLYFEISWSTKKFD